MYVLVIMWPPGQARGRSRSIFATPVAMLLKNLGPAGVGGGVWGLSAVALPMCGLRMQSTCHVCHVSPECDISTTHIEYVCMYINLFLCE